jgi:hypothetical protein
MNTNDEKHQHPRLMIGKRKEQDQHHFELLLGIPCEDFNMPEDSSRN